MKTFILSIYKGHELKLQKTVTVTSMDELRMAKNAFWYESPYTNTGKNWLGVKRIR